MGAGETTPYVDRCECIGRSPQTQPEIVSFHPDRQDTGAAGWRHLLALIDEAADDGRTTFAPFRELSAAESRSIVTLPRSIAKLTSVTHLSLGVTNLVRIPPEIGAMTSLETFDLYMSYRLHWYPYELTRCARLRDSKVSTRTLYGNYKLRPPFPRLRPVAGVGQAGLMALDPGGWGADTVRTCSVCDGPVDREPHQAWISRYVGTDVLPLLVNACSADCVAALPQPRAGYVPTPHTGGPDIAQPPADW
ncbi:leucine-rich repeat domain-containing protein [Rugosimonospora africana]|uniref:Leucine-rich repeat domain-containing protein n=1 Tax=Rugosimonospora africana TaxID=556532 RepID=A0A8J3VPX6_9ACTN|nr:leucine-rich repeat domain-containing protein [Rugosimonospora africana]GIH14559.1 hypothetical protein Raf01_27310 [Rugosimonospora africana]